MSKARNIAALSTVEVGATADQTKADLNAIGVSGGRKNLIINGGFDVWQRGTSFASVNGLTADRWRIAESGGSLTTTREAFTQGQTEVPNNPTYYLKASVTTGDNNCSVRQHIEDVTHTSGETVTVSFWAKGTNPAGGSLEWTMMQRFGSGGSGNVSVTTSFTITSSWVKYTHSFSLASVSGKTIGAGSSLELLINQPAGDTSTTAWELNMANVQVEKGSVATDFEHRSYGEELALCQRYYWKDTHNGMVLTATAANRVIGCIYFPVTMRTTPTIVAEVPTRITQFSVVDKVLAGGLAETSQITPNRADVMFSSFSSGSLDVDNSYISNTASGKYITANAEL